MHDRSTTTSLAEELGVSASIVRRWLREHVDRGGESGPWLIDDDLAVRVRTHFVATAGALDRRVHRRQMRSGRGRAGPMPDALQPVGPPRLDRPARRRQTQRAKTNCPHGHEYTEENMIVSPSGGRQRCRACGSQTSLDLG